jgi:hypothetical protein
MCRLRNVRLHVVAQIKGCIYSKVTANPILTTLASARLLLPAGLAAITDKLPKWQVGNIDRPPPRSRHSPRGGYAPLSLTSTSWGFKTEHWYYHRPAVSPCQCAGFFATSKLKIRTECQPVFPTEKDSFLGTGLAVVIQNFKIFRGPVSDSKGTGKCVQICWLFRSHQKQPDVEERRTVKRAFNLQACKSSSMFHARSKCQR